MKNLVWITDNFLKEIEKAKKLVINEFPLQINTDIYLCSKDTLLEQIKKTIKNKKSFNGKMIKYLSCFAIGKFFKDDNMILLVQGEGDNQITLIHEILHSIQVCSPNRENIVDYITFRILKDESCIETRIKKEWEEIEKNVGWELIKKKFLSRGDCEDF